ncbi:hypothetical protein Glove_117g31 [Diversispora epigaea]|uniref:Uncharacterized protein n=1 Tax=Diversispora epigaea TaxID=1348612 RepID=A0A397JA78_9GLOM|nr:hypothetical protein Glove_117g31 [Diversispora epigaea]
MSASIFLCAKEKKAKAKKIPSNLVRKKYPKLPDFPLGEERYVWHECFFKSYSLLTRMVFSLPFQIGKKISVKNYNKFLDRNEKTGYKFNWEDKNVFIIELASQEHASVVSYLQDCFKEPNNRARIGPIEVSGQPCKGFSFSPLDLWRIITICIFHIVHFNPTGHREKIAPDVAVCPSEDHVLRPLNSHPGPPPSTTNRHNHARIICEIGNIRNTASWETRCENWMHENYVRCVFGVKLDDSISLQGRAHRSMIAKLWTRRALAGSVLSTDPTLAGVGVRVKTWDFGTLQYGTYTPTNCTRVNLPAYQVTIPVSDVFWNPPIVDGVVNDTDYTPTVPEEVVGNNFRIDLYDVQRVVLRAQK